MKLNGNSKKFCHQNRLHSCVVNSNADYHQKCRLLGTCGSTRHAAGGNAKLSCLNCRITSTSTEATSTKLAKSRLAGTTSRVYCLENGTSMPPILEQQPGSHSAFSSLTKFLPKAQETTSTLILTKGSTNLCAPSRSSYSVGLHPTSAGRITVCGICGIGCSRKSVQGPIKTGRTLTIFLPLLLICSRSKTPFQSENRQQIRAGPPHESVFVSMGALEHEILKSPFG